MEDVPPDSLMVKPCKPCTPCAGAGRGLAANGVCAARHSDINPYIACKPCINPVQARGVDARLMEYVPPDILNATDGLDLDLDLNELMVRAKPRGTNEMLEPLCCSRHCARCVSRLKALAVQNSLRLSSHYAYSGRVLYAFFCWRRCRTRRAKVTKLLQSELHTVAAPTGDAWLGPCAAHAGHLRVHGRAERAGRGRFRPRCASACGGGTCRSGDTSVSEAPVPRAVSQA